MGEIILNGKRYRATAIANEKMQQLYIEFGSWATIYQRKDSEDNYLVMIEIPGVSYMEEVERT
jgi:HSP20 family molecular chaperone IbpA